MIRVILKYVFWLLVLVLLANWLGAGNVALVLLVIHSWTTNTELKLGRKQIKSLQEKSFMLEEVGSNAYDRLKREVEVLEKQLDQLRGRFNSIKYVQYEDD